MKKFSEKDIEKAKVFIKEKHKGQLRKQGTPYYTHPIAVAELVKQYNFQIEYQLVALYHDLIEDTDVTKEDVENISNAEIAEAVDLLSKKNGYVMHEYIEKISKNEMAKMVKLADRIHNLSEAIYANKEFQDKYIKETEKWFIPLAEGTCFEELIKKVLNKLAVLY